MADLETLQAKGGLLMFPFDETAERSVLIFLSILSGSLFTKGSGCYFSQFLDEPFLEHPDGHGNIWLIHQAPRFKNLPLIMESWLKEGRVILATGTPEMWEQYPLKVPFQRITAFVDHNISFEKEEKVFFDQAEEEVKTDSLVEKAYHLTALFDGWGVPLPFDLLARMVDKDEGGDNLAPVIEAAYKKGILFWIEREKPPALSVSTRSESCGRKFLCDLAEKGKLSLGDYQPVLASIDAKEMEERFTALKLFESWLTDNHLRFKLSKENFGIKKIREWILENWESVQKIALAGSASEILVWGQCLQHLGLYEKAQKIFESGLKKYRANPYLLQARAHLLSKWGGSEPGKQEEAFRAFSDSVRIVKGNPYLWQAWGVFEAERGNRHGAESYFKRALDLDPKNICTLTARADMYLELGFFDKANEDLEKARQIDPENVYVKHITGRWHFYLGGPGEWDKAINAWNELLTKDKRNLYALQSLGHLFRERGDQIKAKELVEKALDIDPENVPALLEKGLLEKEIGQLNLAVEETSLALEIEPDNPKLIVALAGIERRLDDKKVKAKARLLELISRWPDNLHAHHVLALCFWDEEDKLSATKHLQIMIDKSNGRNYLSFLTLSEIAFDEGNREKAETLLEDATNSYQAWSNNLPSHKKINALLEMARLFQLIGNLDNADLWINKALEIDKENKKILDFQERIKK